MRFTSSTCQLLAATALLVSASFAASPAPNAQAANNNFKINEHGISFQYPQGWSVEHRGNMYRLVRTTSDKLQKLTNADRQGLATITTSVENRKDHADALLRLRQIAAESGTPSTFLTIGGWPGLQRTQFVATPHAGREDKPIEEPGTLVHVTTAIAAGNKLFRMDGFVDQ